MNFFLCFSVQACPAPHGVQGLTWNPVFLSWIPAGVYADENRGGKDDFLVILTHQSMLYNKFFTEKI